LVTRKIKLRSSSPESGGVKPASAKRSSKKAELSVLLGPAKWSTRTWSGKYYGTRFFRHVSSQHGEKLPSVVHSGEKKKPEGGRGKGHHRQIPVQRLQGQGGEQIWPLIGGFSDRKGGSDMCEVRGVAFGGG